MDSHPAQPTAAVLAREHPCPNCGYDLRAAVGGRCPECGSVTPCNLLTTSRLPWAHRRAIGRVRGYLATLFLLVRPHRLAKEMHARQKRRDAESFHRVSLYLAVALGTVLLLTAMRISLPRDLPAVDANGFWIIPAFLLLDSWWLAVPLALALWISFRIIMAGYRAILRLGVRGDIDRRRATMIGFYASGLLPIEATCISFLYLGLIAANADWRAIEALQFWFGFAGIIFAALGLAIYMILSLTLAIKIGRRPWLRGILVVFYGILGPFLAIALIITCAWLAGYTALAIRMMTM